MSINIGIEDVGIHLPQNRGKFSEWSRIIGAPQKLINEGLEKYKIDEYFISEQDPLAMATLAVENLLEKQSVQPDEVDGVIYFHTLQTSIPFHPESIPVALCRTFGLKNATAFSLAQQNCVSYMVAINLIRQIMSVDNSINNILLVGSDRILDEGVRNIDGMQMESDGAACALLRRNSSKNIVKAVGLLTQGKQFKGVSPVMAQGATNDKMIYLVLHRLLTKTLKESGLTKFDVDAVIPHNVNSDSIRLVIESIGISKDHVYDRNIPRYGHMFGSDTIINLSTALNEDFISKGDNVLQISLGFGRTYGCLILTI